MSTLSLLAALLAPARAAGTSLSLVLAPVGSTDVAQGAAFGYSATLTNSDSQSQSVTMLFTLSDPNGGTWDYSQLQTSIPGNASRTSTGRVVPTQQFANLGTYQISATVNSEPMGAPLAFTVSDPTIVVPQFEDVTASAGLSTTLPATQLCPGVVVIGAAWGDANGDGWLDLYQPVPNAGPSQLWINDGSGHFTNEAVARGVEGLGRAAVGANFVDYDNDGDQDLYVVTNGPNELFQNDGTGHFTDVASVAGVADAGVGPHAAWGDFNHDGNPDLYVANHAQCLANQPDNLYQNNGNGTFTNVTTYLGGGAPGTLGDGFGAGWFDYDGDGDDDLYIVNDDLGKLPNQLFRNDGAGPLGTWNFTDVSQSSGTDYLIASMGLAIGDYNRDMRLDFAVSNIGGNVLARNNGDGTFTNVAQSAGVARPKEKANENAVTWGMSFFDLNLDGWEDLFVSAGGTSDQPQGDQLFVNPGLGKTFFDLSAPSGAEDFGSGRGVAFGDYDRDGRIDIYVANMGGSPHLYHNITPYGSSHWLEVDLVGTVSNRSACGAKVIAVVAGKKLLREMFCGSESTASGNDPYLHFGLGAANSVSKLLVTWPSGARQQIRNVAVDQVSVVTEPV